MNKKSGVSPEIMTAQPSGGPTKTEEVIMIDGSTRLNLGSINYRIPIAIPKGRKENELSLAFDFDSAGKGNSEFGMGWDIPVLSVKRRTNKGLPKYDDSDIFVLSTGEELINIGGGRYKTRIESQFRKILKISNHWEITEKDGTKLILGDSQESRIINMTDNTKIYLWYLSRREDTNGNIVVYRYVRDNKWKRYPENIYGSQLYLREILYTNTDDDRFLNVIRFDYEYTLKNERRPDYWTSYHSGFPIQTNWLCKKIVSFTSNIDFNKRRSIDFLSGNRFGTTINSKKYIPHGIFIKPGIDGKLTFKGHPVDSTKQGITTTTNEPIEIDFPIPQKNLRLKIYFNETGEYLFRIIKNDGTIYEKILSITRVGNRTIQIADQFTYIKSIFIQNNNKAFLLQKLDVGSFNDLPTVFSYYELDYHKTIAEEIQVDQFSISPTVKLLKSITRIGYDDALEEDSLPPITFKYSRMSTQGLFPRVLRGTPNESLKDPNTTLIPFTPTGRVDILQTKDQHVCYLNKGQLGMDLLIEGRPLVESPTLKLEEAKTLLRDMDSKGSVDISNDRHFYHNPATDQNGFNLDQLKWGSYEEFDLANPHPQLNTSEMPITRAVDVNHSGAIDLLKTGYDFVLWRNNGDKTWSEPEIIPREYSFGDKNWPNVSFDDERIFIADMNNDKLDEIIRVSSRKVEYWSQVDGKWQFKTTMLNSPRIADFNPKRVLMRDLNEDGHADLIYVHSTGVSIYLNCGGHTFGREIFINLSDYEISRGRWIPSDADSLEIVDFGSGKGILWSFDRTEVEDNYYYMPLSNNISNLLTVIDNGMGGLIELEYSTSTIESTNDELIGQPWESYIPFPLVIIKKIKKTDLVTNTVEETEIKYRNGYYDRDNRELKGFAEVTEKNIGDNSAAGTKIKHFYHNQDLSVLTNLELAEARARSGKEYRKQILDIDTGKLINESFWFWKTLQVYNWVDSGGGTYVPSEPINQNNPEKSIIYPFIKFQLDADYEGTSEPRYKLKENKYEVETDQNIPTEFGNIKEEIFYGEVLDHGVTGSIATLAINGQSKTFYNKSDNNEQLKKHNYAINRQMHIVNLPSKITTWAGENFNNLIGEERFYYDGGANIDDHLSLGEVIQGNLQRKESLWMLEDRLIDVFGSQVIDKLGLDETQGLGFYKRDVTDIGLTGLFIVNEKNIFLISDGKIKYGIIEQSINSRNSGTIFTHDRCGWFIREITNELNHKKTIEEINYRTNSPKIIKDENGSREKFVYDSFGQITAYYTDFDDHPYPITQYTYERKVNFNDPNRKKPNFNITNRLIDDEEAIKRYVQSFKYLDGFNRELQTRLSSEANNRTDFIVTAIKQNKKGMKQVESLPYFNTGSDYRPHDFLAHPGKYFEYDSIGRIVKERWSDDSFSKKTYFPWRIEEYDEEDTNLNSPNYDTPKTIYNDADNKAIRIREILRDEAFSSDVDVNTTCTYDKANNRVEILNAKGQLSSYDLSPDRKILHLNNPDTGERWFLYDALGNLIYSRDAKGNVIWRKYDELSRIKSEILSSDPNDPFDVTYEYDDNTRTSIGRLWHIKCLSEVFEEWREYDKRGNITKLEREINSSDGTNKKSFEIWYNSLKLIKKKTYENGLFTVYKQYGVDGNLKNVIVQFRNGNQKEIIKDISYHPFSKIKNVDFLDGEVFKNMDYDPIRLWFTNIKTTNRNGNILQDLQYTLVDKAGNILNIDDSADPNNVEVYSYKYNSFYWLKEAKFHSPVSQDYLFYYRYDLLGNFEKNDEFNSVEDLWYDLADKPNAVRGIAANHNLFDYDENGYMIKSDRLKELTWNEKGHLRSIKNIAEDYEEIYLYSNTGIRTYTKTEINAQPPKETLYFYEDFEIRNGKKLLHLLLGKERVACIDSNENVYIYLTNHIGNVNKWAKEDGTVDVDYSEIYSPFGESSKTPIATDKQYRFVGSERNDFGLYYFKARYYDSKIGRFISPDPIVFRSFARERENKNKFIIDPNRLNLYTYVLNNPLKYIDPTGLVEITPEEEALNLRILIKESEELLKEYGKTYQEQMPIIEQLEKERGEPPSGPTWKEISDKAIKDTERKLEIDRRGRIIEESYYRWREVDILISKKQGIEPREIDYCGIAGTAALSTEIGAMGTIIITGGTLGGPVGWVSLGIGFLASAYVGFMVDISE